MLKVIYGKDRNDGRTRFRVLRDELGKKSKEQYLVLEGEVTENFLTAQAASQGLFGGDTLFIFDCVFDKKVEQEVLLSCATNLVSSANLFLIFEPSLDKSIAGELKDAGAVVEEYAGKNTNTRPEFNIFSLGDALGRRNKKELWVLYQDALVAGLSSEEICGTLFWAVKNIALMKEGISGDSGLNPFVAKKTREFSKNYTQDEVVSLSSSLVTAYHEAHRGGESLEIALERFILTL